MQRVVPRRRSRQSAASACLCRPPRRFCGGWHEQPPQLHRGGGGLVAWCGQDGCLFVDGIARVLLDALNLARARHPSCPHLSELVASRAVCSRSPVGRVEDRGNGGPALPVWCERRELLAGCATARSCVVAVTAFGGGGGRGVWESCCAVRGRRSSDGRRRHSGCLRGGLARNHC